MKLIEKVASFFRGKKSLEEQIAEEQEIQEENTRANRRLELVQQRKAVMRQAKMERQAHLRQAQNLNKFLTSSKKWSLAEFAQAIGQPI